jgi:hypothetical protein
VNFDTPTVIDLITQTTIQVTPSRVPGLVGKYAVQITRQTNQISSINGIPWPTPVIASGISVELLFQPSSDFFSAPVLQSDLICQFSSNGTNLVLSIYNASKLVFGFSLGGVFITVQYVFTTTDLNNLSNSSFHHFTATFDSSISINNVNLYIDGINVGSFSEIGELYLQPNNHNMFIGNSENLNNPAPDLVFQGFWMRLRFITMF